MAKQPRQAGVETPEPAKGRPEQTSMGPGQTDHSFLLQAMYQTQRDIGTLISKVDAVGDRLKCVEDKMEELSTKLSHAKGWLTGATVVVAIIGGFLLWLFADKLTDLRSAILTQSNPAQGQQQIQP